MTRRIDLLAGTRNTPAAIDRLHSAHDSCEIFADGQIAACQFLQHADPCPVVIDRAELVHVQPVGQLACIDPVILVPLSAIIPRIAHHEFRYMRLQQVVQPGGPGSFFKGDLQLSTKPVDKVQALKALYRSWGIPCAGNEVYAPRHRSEWLSKITEAGVRRRAEHYDQQLDVLRLLRQEVRRDLLAESRKHKAWKLLRLIPGSGPIRSALLVALLQTPHRFRTQRQLWTYSGLGLETHDSAPYRLVDGQLNRSKKSVTLRGLNKDHNHDLKDISKGAATRVSSRSGPLRDFYEALLAKGRKPTMARRTLARQIAAITLIVWNKEVRFDANYLKPQAA